MGISADRFRNIHKRIIARGENSGTMTMLNMLVAQMYGYIQAIEDVVGNLEIKGELPEIVIGDESEEGE